MLQDNFCYKFNSCLRTSNGGFSHFYTQLSKIMPLICFAQRNKEGDARASDDIRVAEQTSGVIHAKPEP